MIEIVLIRDQAGAVNEVLVRGHSGYAPRGQDVVCAGVSALVQTAAESLRRVARVSPLGQVGEEQARIALPGGLAPAQRERAAIVLDSLVVGLGGVARGYPDFVRIREERR